MTKLEKGNTKGRPIRREARRGFTGRSSGHSCIVCSLRLLIHFFRWLNLLCFLGCWTGSLIVWLLRFLLLSVGVVDCAYSSDGFVVIFMLHVVTSVRAKRGQHLQTVWVSSQARMHLVFIRREKHGKTKATHVLQADLSNNIVPKTDYIWRGKGRAFCNKISNRKQIKNNGSFKDRYVLVLFYV